MRILVGLLPFQLIVLLFLVGYIELFQPVVQPALGILMIGAIAGSVGNEDE
jgi:uncharacterized protein YqgC (DUF456 family)